MDKPKISALRPSSTLEVLDRAFRVYRENFALVISLVAIAMVPLTAINLFNTFYVMQRLQSLTAVSGSARFNNSNYSAALLQTYGLTILLAFVIGLAQGLLVNAPLTYIASERYLGRQVTIGQAYRAVVGRLLSLGLGLILFYLILGGLMALTVVTLFICIGFGMIGVVIFVGINFYAFLIPVIVLERGGVGRSIGRAWFLAKARFWPLFWLTLAVLMTTSVIGVALTLTRQAVIGGTIGGASYISSQIGTIIFQSVANMFIIPVLPLAYTMMYYDTRTRIEGLDIALESVDAPEPRPADVISPPPGPFMERRDWRSLLIMAVVGLAPVLLVLGMISVLIGTLSTFR